MILGLDLSLTGTGVVVINDNAEVIENYTVGEKLPRKARQKDKIERILDICKKICTTASEHKVKRIGIEGFAFQARGAQNDLGELHGVVKSQIWLSFAIEPEIIPPTSARKKALGSGKIKKKEVVNALTKLGYKCNDHNQADALVIALAILSEGEVE